MSDGQFGPLVSRNDRGFALLIVLWSLALLSLLAVRLTATSRTELQLAANIRNAAVVEAQADGLLYGAIVQLMRDTPQERGADGIAHAIPTPGGAATMRISSLAGRINPNVASEDILQALIQQVGMAAEPASRLVAAIADWRTPGQNPRPNGAKAAQYQAASLPYTPPNAPFASIDEVGLVLGMTPDLLARLAPHLTVFYPADPVWTAADPVVAQALQRLGLVDATASPEGTDSEADYVQIIVQVSNTSGASFTRRALVWVGHGLLRGRYRVLSWDVAADETT